MAPIRSTPLHPDPPVSKRAGSPVAVASGIFSSEVSVMWPVCVCVSMHVCVCARVGENVLPTLGASGASVREPGITGPKSDGSARHVTWGGRGRSNPARPRYQHAGHLFGGGLPSAVRSCHSEEKGGQQPPLSSPMYGSFKEMADAAREKTEKAQTAHPPGSAHTSSRVFLEDKGGGGFLKYLRGKASPRSNCSC